MSNRNRKVNTHSFTKEWVFMRFVHRKLYFLQMQNHHLKPLLCNCLENHTKKFMVGFLSDSPPKKPPSPPLLPESRGLQAPPLKFPCMQMNAKPFHKQGHPA